MHLQVVCTHVWRPEDSFSCHFWGDGYLALLRKVLSLAWSLPSGLKWPENPREPLNSISIMLHQAFFPFLSSLHFPPQTRQNKTNKMNKHGFRGTKLGSSCLQACYWLSYHPSCGPYSFKAVAVAVLQVCTEASREFKELYDVDPVKNPYSWEGAGGHISA